MNEHWKPALKPGSTLENPSTGAAPDKSLEKQDTLNAASSSAPLPPAIHAALPLPRAQFTEVQKKRLNRLRSSPAYRLIANSTLLLKTCRMDLDYPPPLRDYVRARLKEMLDKFSESLSSDALGIRFSTDTCPEVNNQGREQYSRRLSLTNIALLSLNGKKMQALLRCRFDDKPLVASSPAFTAGVALKLISAASWLDDYAALMQTFWDRHHETYRALLKLTFLHDLARQFATGLISREGYELALDAAGLQTFPDSAHSLFATGRGIRSSLHMLSSDDRLLPGAFQLKSNNTSHCFIHTPGRRITPQEYISDNVIHMTQKLADAMPADDNPDEDASVPELVLIHGDVFTAIAEAHQESGLHYLDMEVDCAPQPNPFRAIGSGLALLAAVDIWQLTPDVSRHLPAPKQYANTLMTRLLREKYNRALNPDQVFIRYLRGSSITALGDARHPNIDFQVPSEQPLSLSEALVSNYRVATPVGYIDHGGRSVVYLDPTGEGRWSTDNELPIAARDLESDIRQIDFLQLMTNHLEQFWEQHKAKVEESLQSHFVTQALLCVKHGSLRRDGLDLLVNALDEQLSTSARNLTEWSVPGFFLQHSVLENPKIQYCPSLLVLRQGEKPLRVLYQAGMVKAFTQFESEDALRHYFRHAARSQTWRQSLLNYVPLRQHERLTYILKIWGGERPPSEPASILRPWTDVLLNHDAHQAMAQQLGARRGTGSPFAYIARTLQQNSLWNAEDTAVTAREVSLNYWSRQLHHLQLLLAPMSLLMTPALIASLANEFGIAALSVAAAQLPGGRHAEKQQALLAVLSLGLLQLPPTTPRLANALRRLTSPAKPLVRATTSVPPITRQTFRAWLGQSMQVRQTRLEKFFHTDALLKTWSIPGHPAFSTLDVKVWKLPRHFLLWTAEHRQARTLVVSTHGYCLPWSKSARIPNGTELQVYAPHGHELVDPALHRVVSKKVMPFAVLDTQRNTPRSPPITAYEMTDKLMAGTTQPGMVRNYSLSKFQTAQNESYRDISHIVRNSNQSPFMGLLPTSPMDVLTVRNRFAMQHPTLEQLFRALSDAGIHYDRIVLLHCRCSAFKSLIGKAPIHKAS